MAARATRVHGVFQGKNGAHGLAVAVAVCAVLRALFKLRGVMARCAGQGKGNVVGVPPVPLFQGFVMADGASLLGHIAFVVLEGSVKFQAVAGFALLPVHAGF